MDPDRFTFEGLSDIEERLLRMSSDIAYLVVQDRTVPKADETLGRFDFEPHFARPYLEVSEPDTTDAADWEASLPPPDESPTPDQIAQAACRWIRDIAARCTLGERWRRFRVKAWGPKAYRMIDSGQFLCRDLEAELELSDEGELPEFGASMELDLERSTQRGVAQGMEALGGYYAQWGQLVLGSINQLQGIHNRTTVRLHQQLQQSRNQVDLLVSSILEYRAKEASQVEVRQSEQRDTEARTALARDALHQIGEAARALLSTQELPPDLTEIVDALAQSPALLETLRQPAVRELMRDPAHLEQLASLLQAAAAQASVSAS